MGEIKQLFRKFGTAYVKHETPVSIKYCHTKKKYIKLGIVFCSRLARGDAEFWLKYRNKLSEPQPIKKIVEGTITGSLMKCHVNICEVGMKYNSDIVKTVIMKSISYYITPQYREFVCHIHAINDNFVHWNIEKIRWHFKSVSFFIFELA